MNRISAYWLVTILGLGLVLLSPAPLLAGGGGDDECTKHNFSVKLGPYKDGGSTDHVTVTVTGITTDGSWLIDTSAFVGSENFYTCESDKWAQKVIFSFDTFRSNYQINPWNEAARSRYHLPAQDNYAHTFTFPGAHFKNSWVKYYADYSGVYLYLDGRQVYHAP